MLQRQFTIFEEGWPSLKRSKIFKIITEKVVFTINNLFLNGFSAMRNICMDVSIWRDYLGTCLDFNVIILLLNISSYNKQSFVNQSKDGRIKVSVHCLSSEALGAFILNKSWLRASLKKTILTSSSQRQIIIYPYIHDLHILRLSLSLISYTLKF